MLCLFLTFFFSFSFFIAYACVLNFFHCIHFVLIRTLFFFILRHLNFVFVFEMNEMSEKEKTRDFLKAKGRALK